MMKKFIRDFYDAKYVPHLMALVLFLFTIAIVLLFVFPVVSMVIACFLMIVLYLAAVLLTIGLILFRKTND